MKLINELNQLIEAKKQSHSFNIKDWDILAGAKGDVLIPKQLDVEVHYNISKDGDIEDLEILTTNKIELLDSDEEVKKTLPAGSDFFKIPSYQSSMDKEIDELVWKDYEAWVKYQRENP